METKYNYMILLEYSVVRRGLYVPQIERRLLLGFVSQTNSTEAYVEAYTKYGTKGGFSLDEGEWIIRLTEVPGYLNSQFLKEAEKTYQWISAMHEDKINGADNYASY